MHRLIHQRAAALALPGASPGVPGEILAVAPQERDTFRDRYSADAPLFDRRVHALRRGKETSLAYAAQFDAMELGGLDEHVSLFERDRDRLLDDHVDAALDRR